MHTVYCFDSDTYTAKRIRDWISSSGLRSLYARKFLEYEELNIKEEVNLCKQRLHVKKQDVFFLEVINDSIALNISKYRKHLSPDTSFIIFADESHASLFLLAWQGSIIVSSYK